jgi:hypothetical protein
MARNAILACSELPDESTTALASEQDDGIRGALVARDGQNS